MGYDIDEKKMAARRARNLACLEDLGFGPDSILMSDPKLFLDGAFLAIVTAEFDQELGAECSRQALREIGRHHGICDAIRTLAAESLGELERNSTRPQSGPNLAIQFGPPPPDSQGLVLKGSWPEGHEARARLSRLGASPEPSCALSAGYSAGWLSEIHDTEVKIVETSCRASGDDRCRFEAHLESTGARPAGVERSGPDTPSAISTLQAVEGFCPEARDMERTPSDQIDPQDDAVHAWGPVMVLPFSDPGVAESTLHSLEGDSLIRDIRAVVIDLRGQPIDSEAALVGIERILKILDRWPAQPVFAGVSAANEKTLQTFGSDCFVAHQKLPEAIATAFQIAEAQRHAL
jgi:hypothetical protein